MTTLTVHREDDGQLTVVGDAPNLIYIDEELLSAHEPVVLTVSGSSITFHTDPPLRYLIRGASDNYAPARVWIAEKVRVFA